MYSSVHNPAIDSLIGEARHLPIHDHFRQAQAMIRQTHKLYASEVRLPLWRRSQHLRKTGTSYLSPTGNTRGAGGRPHQNENNPPTPNVADFNVSVPVERVGVKLNPRHFAGARRRIAHTAMAGQYVVRSLGQFWSDRDYPGSRMGYRDYWSGKQPWDFHIINQVGTTVLVTHRVRRIVHKRVSRIWI